MLLFYFISGGPISSLDSRNGKNWSTLLIKDRATTQAMLTALANDEARRLLDSTISKSKSVVDLIRECDIAHTSAYRLVNELKDAGLLAIEKMGLSSDGKKYAMYRSTFRSMTVKFDHGQVEVDAEVNGDMAQKVFRLFYSLSSGGDPE